MATKEQRKNKQMVEKLLMIEGVKYDDWVDEIHTEYIQSNQNLIFKALDSQLDMKNKKEEKTFNNQSQNKFNK